nr:hypothetical protein CFP56_44345 [Quercus suber]
MALCWSTGPRAKSEEIESNGVKFGKQVLTVMLILTRLAGVTGGRYQILPSFLSESIPGPCAWAWCMDPEVWGSWRGPCRMLSNAMEQSDATSYRLIAHKAHACIKK